MAKKKSNFYYHGFTRPTTTPVPDDIFDVIAPELTEAELRVLLYIVRRTFGFKKDTDQISLSQMVKGIKTKDGRVLDRGTGMSRRGVMRGCTGLEEKGIITVEKSQTEEGDYDINVYSLRFRDNEGVGNQIPYGREPGSPGVGNEVALQQTVVQQTDVVVIDQLIEKEIAKDKSQELATRYSPDYLQEKIEFLEWKLKLQSQGKARGRPIGDPAAWLIKAIEKDYKPPDEFYQWRQHREAIEIQEAEEEQRKANTQQREREIRQRLREQVGAPPDKELEETWKRTLDDLQEATTKAAFKTWLAQSELLLLENGEAVIGFSNAFARDRVQASWTHLVQEALSKHLGDQQVALKFITLEQPQNSEAEPP